MRDVKYTKFGLSLSRGNVKEYLKLRNASAKEIKRTGNYLIVDVL